MIRLLRWSFILAFVHLPRIVGGNTRIHESIQRHSGGVVVQYASAERLDVAQTIGLHLLYKQKKHHQNCDQISPHN